MEQKPSRDRRELRGPQALHLERKKSACWPDLKDAFSSKAVAAEIFIKMLAQIPLPMNNSSPGYFDGMVEIAIFKFDPITRQCERSIRHPSVLKSEILTLGLLVPPAVTITPTSFERDRLPARGIGRTLALPSDIRWQRLSFDKAGLLQTRREPGQQVRIKVGCLAMQDPNH